MDSNIHTYIINTTKEELNIETLVINVEPVLIDTSPRDNSTYIINSMISNNLTNRLKTLKKTYD